MIDVTCQCGAVEPTPESTAGFSIACPACSGAITLLCGEQLPEGAGAGDFDARLVVRDGPARVGEQLHLGGVADIEIGKLPDKHLSLPGKMVSRNHCKLQRVDFGPSRWKIVDLKSTNGLFVNGQRVTEHELVPGDLVRIGEYEFTYEVAEPPAAPPPPPPMAKPAGKACPACGKQYAATAKICTQCGINIDTGKPLVISKEFDENVLAGNVDTTVRAVSFFLPFGLFPIASEAYATKKPIATWVIFGITLLVSVWFLIVTDGVDQRTYLSKPQVANLMHWTGSGDVQTLGNLDAAKLKKFVEALLPKLDEQIAKSERLLQGSSLTAAERAEMTQDLAETKALRARLLKDPAGVIRDVLRDQGEDVPEVSPEIGFRWYQLLTSAFLHGGVMHFVGNMVFLLVFGLRVNQLVGNLKFAIIYPVLAMGSGLIDHIVHLNDPMVPGLGASGAIMGLAGMYLFFFPFQKVHTVAWLRVHWRFPCWYKVFRMRGIWLLALWIAFNDGLPMILKSKDHVGHWAHMGGLIVGVSLAIILLVARLVNALGGDLISITLGKRAWALIGKPRMALG